MQISTDGCCPSCGSRKFTPSTSSDGITVSCCDCCSYYIRLTGAGAMGYRKANPDNPGIFTGEAIIDATNEALDFEKNLKSAWKTSELAECVSLLEQLVGNVNEDENDRWTAVPIPHNLLNEARAKIESLRKFLATKVLYAHLIPRPSYSHHSSHNQRGV